jgi:hypothetical protein
MHAACRFLILIYEVAATNVQAAVTADKAQRAAPIAPSEFIPTFLAFHNGIVFWLAERDKQLVLNFGNMACAPENWIALDRQPHPVFTAMEEGSLASVQNRSQPTSSPRSNIIHSRDLL